MKDEYKIVYMLTDVDAKIVGNEATDTFILLNYAMSTVDSFKNVSFQNMSNAQKVDHE